VRSRLNAHLVVISSPSALQLSEFLRSALKLPIRHDRISQSFIDLHNCGVDELFGTYTTPDDDVVGQHSSPVVTDKRSTFVPGRLFPLLTKHREWGRDIEFFCACALKTVMALSAEHPHLTEEMFERSVLSMVSQTRCPSAFWTVIKVAVLTTNESIATVGSNQYSRYSDRLDTHRTAPLRFSGAQCRQAAVCRQREEIRGDDRGWGAGDLRSTGVPAEEEGDRVVVERRHYCELIVAV